MCFDAAKASKWITGQRLNHIGFGVVCGDDGKRFRTRGSDTVRLIDLLDESKTRMTESLRTRVTEGKSSLTVCVHMYVTYCAPYGIKGFLTSLFMTSTHVCHGLSWIIYQGGHLLFHMWVLLGGWIMTNIVRLVYKED